MNKDVLAPPAVQVQQERTAVLAEERANFERLLVAVSTTLNQDLPNKLQASWPVYCLVN